MNPTEELQKLVAALELLNSGAVRAAEGAYAPGHPFHGNQWTEATGFEQSKLSKAHGDVLVVADVAKMEAGFQRNKDQYVAPGGGGGIGNRYQNVAEFLKQNKAVYSPIVHLGHLDKSEVHFVDGRHRYSYLRDHGVKHMPVAVIAEHAEEFRKRFGVSQ